MRLKIIFLLLLIWCAGCEPASITGGTVGCIYDNATGTALAGVTVSIGEYQDVTDTEGRYSIAGLAQGVYTLTATHAAYEDYSRQIIVAESTQLVCDISLVAIEHAPDAPGDLRVTCGDGKNILLWESAARAQGYNIYWSTEPGVGRDNGTKISGITASPYVHRGLTNAETYYYAVTAVNKNGESDITGVVQSVPAPLLPESPACGSRLDNETLSYLTISWPFSHLQMQPGESRSFELYVIECCYSMKSVNVCAVWSMTPQAGAAIDPRTGYFEVDEDTPSGTEYTIVADIEDGRRVLSRKVFIYNPDDNPLVGTWSESYQLTCSNGRQVVPNDRIEEIVFYANGTFTVTWLPFEVYLDYWGDYSFDASSGTVSMQITDGNYIPDDFDGEGFYALDEDGRLVLSDLWLGNFDDGGIPRCGHVLE